MSTYVDPFDSDFAKLQADAQSFADMQTEAANANAAYETAFENLKNIKNPMVLFMMMFALIANEGSEQLNDSLAVGGAGLQVQGDLTKLGNDLENNTNQKDTTTGDNGLLAHTAAHLDQILDALSSSSTSPIDIDIQNAVGSTASSALFGQYKAIREDIYWKNDPNQTYNPDPVPTPPPPLTPRTYHFSVDDAPGTPNGYITSYGELQSLMGQQGDPSQASEAAKLKTDAFNMNTSTTQSTNAASNEVITNDKNTMTSWQSFSADMMHSVADLIKAAVQTMGRG